MVCTQNTTAYASPPPGAGASLTAEPSATGASSGSSGSSSDTGAIVGGVVGGVVGAAIIAVLLFLWRRRQRLQEGSRPAGVEERRLSIDHDMDEPAPGARVVPFLPPSTGSEPNLSLFGSPNLGSYLSESTLPPSTAPTGTSSTSAPLRVTNPDDLAAAGATGLAPRPSVRKDGPYAGASSSLLNRASIQNDQLEGVREQV